ncbi:MAG: glycosyltransferase family 4 protein [Flavobacteriales bacterium]|nr:glycosyltransferase family 4 protein [Flavobacteriales bacterium]
MVKSYLIYRKHRSEFNSIENVFNTLLTYLKVNKVELPFFSEGIVNRLKNISFVKKLKTKLYHITGNDHYIILGLKNRTTVLTIHDIEILKRNSGIKRLLLKKIWFDWPIKYATCITTISEFSKAEILSISNYKTPIHVIHNPLTLKIKYSPKPFNYNCPTILHIGTKANKNLTLLIKALNGIKCHLNIIGKPSFELDSLLDSNNISYTFKSNLTNEEMIKEYENCDLLAFVSTYEGFGLPIIEAQAAGRVVITSNLASMPEVAGDGAYFVNPYDTNEIRKGILELINNDNLREVLIQKGLENVKHFEPQKIAKQYLELYNQVLNET